MASAALGTLDGRGYFLDPGAELSDRLPTSCSSRIADPCRTCPQGIRGRVRVQMFGLEQPRMCVGLRRRACLPGVRHSLPFSVWFGEADYVSTWTGGTQRMPFPVIALLLGCRRLQRAGPSFLGNAASGHSSSAHNDRSQGCAAYRNGIPDLREPRLRNQEKHVEIPE